MQPDSSTHEVYKKTLKGGNEKTTIEQKEKQSSIVKERKNSHVKVKFMLLFFKGQEDRRERSLFLSLHMFTII